MTYVRLDPAQMTHMEPADPGDGTHLWIYTVGFRVSEDTAHKMAHGQDAGLVQLDHESMIIPPQLGCYKCEEPFSRYLFHRKCTGSMEVQP